MKPIFKSFLAVIGTIAAVGLLMLAAPRAAHAVVAALVQVTNTASSPVITQGIGNQAAQIVEIECGYIPGTNSVYPAGCQSIPATGVGNPAQLQSNRYVVPNGQTLVVTAVDILSGSAAGSPCMSPAFAQVLTGVPTAPLELLGTRKSWIVPPGAGTFHIVYPSGILFSAGTQIDEVVNETTSCTVTLDMHGYLSAQ